MIRAHLATFPPRRKIMLETVACIIGQVDRLFIILNEYDEIPAELAGNGKIEALIPPGDTKDTGKFYFAPGDDDVVFTIDDDILYPADYVAHSLAEAEPLGLDRGVFGYQANAWAYKKAESRYGWKNFMFFKELNKPHPVDVIGTGTACMLGRNAPPFAALAGSAGFVDIRFARWQQQQQNPCWVLPRPAEYLKRNLPEHLHASSLFNTVARSNNPELNHETRLLIEGAPRRGAPAKAGRT
ncbi:MAG: hypothetical protein ACK5LJ_11665 [Paracoccus sp. (in: a-proteobacteria)]